MWIALCALLLTSGDERPTDVARQTSSPSVRTPDAPAERPIEGEVEDEDRREAEQRAGRQAQEDESYRVTRMLWTGLGAALGAVGPFMIGHTIDASRRCTPAMFCATDIARSAVSSVLPLTVAVGLGAPHSLAGGRAGLGFGLGGAVSGYTLGAVLMALVSLAVGTDWAKSAPLPGAGLLVAMGTLGAVAGMELRHSALEAGAPPWKLSRSIAEGAAFWVPTVLVEVGILAFTNALRTQGGDLALILTAGTLVNYALSATAAWGAHRALDGSSPYWPALVGALAGTAAAVGFIAIHQHGPPQGGAFGSTGGISVTHAYVPVLIISSMIALVGPSVGLEWADGRLRQATSSPSTAEPSNNVQVQFTGGLAPGGASLGLGGRF